MVFGVGVVVYDFLFLAGLAWSRLGTKLLFAHVCLCFGSVGWMRRSPTAAPITHAGSLPVFGGPDPT